MSIFTHWKWWTDLKTVEASKKGFALPLSGTCYCSSSTVHWLPWAVFKWQEMWLNCLLLCIVYTWKTCPSGNVVPKTQVDCYISKYWTVRAGADQDFFSTGVGKMVGYAVWIENLFLRDLTDRLVSSESWPCFLS